MLKADILITSRGRLVYAKYGKSFATRTQYQVYLETLDITLNGDKVESRLYLDARYCKTKR